MKSLALIVSDELREILKVKDRAILAVPGGSTPKPFFELLSMIDLEWERIIVIPTDERFVPHTSPLSNFALINQTLIKRCAVNAKLLSFFQSNLPIKELAKVISNEVKTFLPIDVCILGMGADMHIASIFPKSDRLQDALDLSNAEIVIPIQAPNVNEGRLTLTAKILRDSPKRHLLITGSDKKAALEFALNATDNWQDAPVRSVICGEEGIRIHFSD